MSNSAVALESTLEKIARIIARRRGVRVVLRGGSAGIDLEKMEVVLPQVTDAQYQDMAPYIDGICDHEVGHILWTNPKVFKESGEGVDGKLRRNLWNVLEDYRTEGQIASQYIGCGQNISKMNAYFTDWWVKHNWVKADMFGRLLFAIGCKLRGAVVSIDLDHDLCIGALLQVLLPEVAVVKARLLDSQAALAVADSMLLEIKKLVEFQTKGEFGARKNDRTEEAEELSDGDFVKSDKKAENVSKTVDCIEIGNNQRVKEAGEANEGKRAKDAETGEEINNARATAKKQAKKFEETKEKFEKPVDIEDFVNQHINALSNKSKTEDEDSVKQPNEYLVFSEEFDTEKHYTVDERLSYAASYGQIKAQVQEYIGSMATALELALSAEAEDRWVGGAQRGRKLDRRRLADWVMGSTDTTIWKRLIPGEAMNTTVCLLWDCSGSMGSSDMRYNKASLARIAAIAFHEALVRIGIAHEVLGFNTGGPIPDGLLRLVDQARARGDTLERYSRLQETDNRFVFVEYGQTDGRAICAITGADSNRDGEAVMWAAKRLAQRVESRKILMVGSDGQPQGARYTQTEKRYLKDAVLRVIDAGIETIGIGIMTSSVCDYYPNYVVLREVRDLPKVLLGQLMNLLLKKGTTYDNGRRRQALL